MGVSELEHLFYYQFFPLRKSTYSLQKGIFCLPLKFKDMGVDGLLVGFFVGEVIQAQPAMG